MPCLCGSNNRSYLKGTTKSCQVLNSYSPWSQEYHDSDFSSFSKNNPISNDIKWFNSSGEISNNNTIQLNFNPTILPDQSFLIFKISNNNNLQFIKYKFQDEIDWIYNFNNINNNNNNNNNNNINSINANIVIASTINTNNTSLLELPILVYINEFSNFYIFNSLNGLLLWNSSTTATTYAEDSNYIDCTSCTYFPTIYSFYSICQSNITTATTTDIISINLYGGDGEDEITIQRNNLQLLNGYSTVNRSSADEIIYGYPILIKGSGNTITYVNYKIGIVSLLLPQQQQQQQQTTDNTTTSTTTITYQTLVQYQIKPNTFYHTIVKSLYGITTPPFYGTLISMMSCNHGTMSIDSYDVTNGTVMFTYPILPGVDCNKISNAKLGYHSTLGIIFMFIYDYHGSYYTYSGSYIYLPFSLKWYLNADKSYTLDFAITFTNSIYYCRSDNVLLFNQNSPNRLFNYSIDTSSNVGSGYGSSTCKLAIGENTILLSLSNVKEETENEQTISNSETYLFRGIDEMCLDLCGTNMACTLDQGCQCSENYYPAKNCSVYCLASYICNNHGTCDENGTCVCNPETGWYGPWCNECKNGYGGNDCNMTFDKKKAILYIVLGLLLTSSICVFAFCTRRIGKRHKEGKPICGDCLCLMKIRNLFKSKSYSSLSGNEISEIDGDEDDDDIEENNIQDINNSDENVNLKIN